MLKGRLANGKQADQRGRMLLSQKLPTSPRDPSAEAANLLLYSEIEEATNKFEKKIGSGSFGVVYYGRLKDGKEIAAKVLTSGPYIGEHEFMNEVTLISRIHHRNLVKFLGYCQEKEKNILVYEFMVNGTLKEHLHGPSARGKVLSWIKRLEIAEDAAKGVEYLHSGCVPAIIHRDLKTSNILLDINMRAQVADFGLSKLAIDGDSHVSTTVKGTMGYLDPEYYASHQLTEKSDVYSFGVILLELISGKAAVSNESFGNEFRHIVQWAETYIERGDLQGIIDPALAGEYNMQSMWKIAEKAIWCLKTNKNMRPTMSEVVKDIQDAIAMERGVDAGGDGSSSSNYLHSLSELHLGPFSSYDSLTQPTVR